MQAELKIAPGQLEDFEKFFYEQARGIEVYFANKSFENTDQGIEKMFIAYIDKIPAGYVFISKSKNKEGAQKKGKIIIEYLKILPEFCNKGLANALLLHIKKIYAQEYILSLKIIQGHTNWEKLLHLVKKADFKEKERATIFSTNIVDGQEFIIENFLNGKIGKIISRLEKKGFENINFKESGAIYQKLISKIGKDFPRNLDPSIFTIETSDKLVDDYSFITVKKNDPVAFCLVTSADGAGLIVQQLSISTKLKNTGVFLMPLFAFFLKVYSDKHFKKCSYTVYNENIKMQSLAKGFLRNLYEFEKEQIIFEY